MKPIRAAKLANVNPEIVRQWKRVYDNDPEQKVSLQKDTLYIKANPKPTK